MSCKLEEAIRDIEVLASKPGAKQIAKELLEVANYARAKIGASTAKGIQYQRVLDKVFTNPTPDMQTSSVDDNQTYSIKYTKETFVSAFNNVFNNGRGVFRQLKTKNIDGTNIEVTVPNINTFLQYVFDSTNDDMVKFLPERTQILPNGSAEFWYKVDNSIEDQNPYQLGTIAQPNTWLNRYPELWDEKGEIAKQQNGTKEYNSDVADSLASKLQKVYSDIEVIYLNGQGEMRRVLEELSGGLAMFQLSNKRKKEFEAKLRKGRPELDNTKIDDILTSIEEFSEKESDKNEKMMKKLELLALHWTLKGNVILPEDGSKIMDAMRIADKNKLDAFSYNNPNEITETFAKVEEKIKPLNPDDYIGKGYSNKQEWAKGITVYDVDNDDTGRKVSRSMIDTHFGKEANPWCLLARKGGSIEETASFWYQNYPGDKRIAFKDGKLVAFFGGDQWWDRMDNPSEGIIVESILDKDEEGRTPYASFTVTENNVKNEGIRKYTKGSIKSGLYEEWGPRKNKAREITYKAGEKVKDIDFIANKTIEYNKDISSILGVSTPVIGNIVTDVIETTAEVVLIDGYSIQVGTGFENTTMHWLTISDNMDRPQRLHLPQKVINYLFDKIDKGAKLQLKDVKALYEIAYSENYSYSGEALLNVSMFQDVQKSEFNWNEVYGLNQDSYKGVGSYYPSSEHYYQMGFDFEDDTIERGFYDDEDNTYYQKQNDNIKGAAILDKNKILIDVASRSTDTLAHEYAHFYIGAFRDTPIVQEAIKKWGGEEQLVQAIGEQTVKQKGEAYNWWKQFSSWLKGIVTGLDNVSKEKLVELLTDAFLTKQDLTKLESPEIERTKQETLKASYKTSNDIMNDILNCKG